MTSNHNKSGGEIDNAAVEAFVRGLDGKFRMLVILKAQLYGGRWEPMLEDLQNRLEGKPYIFKLANRIKDDVERIGILQEFEKAHGIDLSDYIKLDSQ
ncbi:MAG: hypothetical protein GX298_09325 [Planctomycetes bacterium]|jgi:hypothetical protein|nr:hypothetical protein [Planctomycetota bacterium]